MESLAFLASLVRERKVDIVLKERETMGGLGTTRVGMVVGTTFGITDAIKLSRR